MSHIRIMRPVCLLCNRRCLNPTHFARHVARACRRKATYVILDDAVAMAGSVSRSYGRLTHVYQCPLGDHWHLTTSLRFVA